MSINELPMPIIEYRYQQMRISISLKICRYWYIFIYSILLIHFIDIDTSMPVIDINTWFIDMNKSCIDIDKGISDMYNWVSDMDK